jgi:hypothetical protein
VQLLITERKKIFLFQAPGFIGIKKLKTLQNNYLYLGVLTQSDEKTIIPLDAPVMGYSDGTQKDPFRCIESLLDYPDEQAHHQSPVVAR